jgi:hypothetical protein
LPDDKFVYHLATADPKNERLRNHPRKPNAYSDLLFVYSWTALLHWLVIVFSFAMVFGLGFDHRLGGDHISALTRATDGLLVFLIAYASVQFVITLVTLSQVGRRYVRHLKQRSDANV